MKRVAERSQSERIVFFVDGCADQIAEAAVELKKGVYV
jgi:hypothetical protein